MNESTDPYCLSDGNAAALLAGARWKRLIGVGDSVISGVREPVEGYRDEGWVERLAGILDLVNPGLAYLNLGRRGLLAEQVWEMQLGTALDFRPDLAFVACGGNDMFHREFRPDEVGAKLTAIVQALRETGCDVVTVGLFDITLAGRVPEKYARVWSERINKLNAVTADVAARHGGIHVDNDGHPLMADPSVYSSDNIHFNARGHAIAAAGTVRRLSERLARQGLTAQALTK